MRSSPSGIVGRLMPWKPSQPAIDVAAQLLLGAVVAEADGRAVAVEVVQRHVGDLEAHVAAVAAGARR